ncbi:hypothetical protein [Clostridium arbusti]|uniref:hypothetical protein n=1 Tax=Clostridium arbusti TaxID=1137848 RepID=UPI00028937F2|nr:hypothetical protein [Clostridium arbusti]
MKKVSFKFLLVLSILIISIFNINILTKADIINNTNDTNVTNSTKSDISSNQEKTNENYDVILNEKNGNLNVDFSLNKMTIDTMTDNTLKFQIYTQNAIDLAGYKVDAVNDNNGKLTVKETSSDDNNIKNFEITDIDFLKTKCVVLYIYPVSNELAKNGNIDYSKVNRKEVKVYINTVRDEMVNKLKLIAPSQESNNASASIQNSTNNDQSSVKKNTSVFSTTLIVNKFKKYLVGYSITIILIIIIGIAYLAYRVKNNE